MDIFVWRGQQANIGFAYIQDVVTNIGRGLNGLTSGNATLCISARRELSPIMTIYSQSSIAGIATLGSWVNPGASKIGWRAIDPINARGVYEMQFENALFANTDSSRKLIGSVQVSGGADTPFETILLADNPQFSRLAFQGYVNPGSTPIQVVLDSTAPTSDNALQYDIVQVTGFPTRIITAYSGASRTASVDTFGSGVIPSAGTVAVVIPLALIALTSSQVGQAIWGSARSGNAVAGTFGEGIASVIGPVGSVTGNVGGNLNGDVVGNVGGSVTGNVGGNVQGDVVGNVQGNVTGSVGTIAAGGILPSSYLTSSLTLSAVTFLAQTLSGQTIANSLGLAVKEGHSRLLNRFQTDPATGVVTMYNDIGQAYKTSAAWQDVAGTIAYTSGAPINRLDQFS